MSFSSIDREEEVLADQQALENFSFVRIENRLFESFRHSQEGTIRCGGAAVEGGRAATAVPVVDPADGELVGIVVQDPGEGYSVADLPICIELQNTAGEPYVPAPIKIDRFEGQPEPGTLPFVTGSLEWELAKVPIAYRGSGYGSAQNLAVEIVVEVDRVSSFKCGSADN